MHPRLILVLKVTSDEGYKFYVIVKYVLKKIGRKMLNTSYPRHRQTY